MSVKLVAASPSAKKLEEGANFELALARLEGIVAQLEDGKVGLAEALAVYEEGVKHLRECHELLEKAERKIELLTGVDAQGNPVVRPFEEQEAGASLEKKGASRSRKRSAPAEEKSADDVDDLGRLF